MIQSIHTFITSPIGQILSYIFGIVGFISAIVTFVSYQKAKHIKASNKYIINLLHQGIDNISKSQINELNKELSKLQSAIKDQIPYEAKRTALKEKLYWQTQEFYTQYEALLETRNKLKKLDDEIPIDDNLAKLIENEIEPNYLETRKFNQSKDLLLIMAGISLVLPFFNPILCVISIIPISDAISYFLKRKYRINEKYSGAISSTFIVTIIILGILVALIIDRAL